MTSKNFNFDYLAITGNTTLSTSKYVVISATLAAPATLTLYATSTVPTGSPIYIINSASGNTLTVATNAADTILGAGSMAVPSGHSAVIFSDASASTWHVETTHALSGGTVAVSGPGSSTDTAVAKWVGTGGDTLANTGVLIDASNNTTMPGILTFSTAGNGFKIKEGANARMGTATLVAGSVVVATTVVTTSSRIFLSVVTPGGTPGQLSTATRVAGTSFTITSSNALDTSTVAWWLIEPAP